MYVTEGEYNVSIEFVRDAIDKRKDEMREKYRASGGTAFDQTEVINKRKGKHYRGVNEHPSRIAYFKAQGYEVVKKDDAADWSVRTSDADGVKKFGEQVLMEIDVDRLVENAARMELRQERRELSTKEEVRAKMNDIAKTYLGHEPRGGDITFDDSERGSIRTDTIIRQPTVPVADEPIVGRKV